MNTIEQYAQLGAHHDVMDALILLTNAYIDKCGISMTDRTVIYNSAEAWQDRLASMNLPLSEMAKNVALVSLMPHISSDYIPERYDKYDITVLSNDELLEYCKEIIEDAEFDEATLVVLCWGILEYCKDN